MAHICKQCGSEEHYNFALNIGLCDCCIGETLDQLQAENKRLKEVLEYIANECFEAMEGAGLPEFENYRHWFDKAKNALKD